MSVGVSVYVGGIIKNPNEDLNYAETIEEPYFFFFSLVKLHSAVIKGFEVFVLPCFVIFSLPLLLVIGLNNGKVVVERSVPYQVQ